LDLNLKHIRFYCSIRVVILAFFWTVSLICGVCISANDQSVVSLMRLLPYAQVSIVGLILVLFVPLLISIICVRFANLIVIYIISALKGFLLGYCLYGISAAFGDSGWLMRFLLFFSESCSTFVLLWFWVRQLGGICVSFRRDCISASLASLIIGMIDYLLVSPFLTSLMNEI